MYWTNAWEVPETPLSVRKALECWPLLLTPYTAAIDPVCSWLSSWKFFLQIWTAYTFLVPVLFLIVDHILLHVFFPYVHTCSSPHKVWTPSGQWEYFIYLFHPVPYTWQEFSKSWLTLVFVLSLLTPCIRILYFPNSSQV